MSIKRWALSFLCGVMLLGLTTAVSAAPASAIGQQHLLLTADGATGHLVSFSADFRARATTLNYVPIKGLVIEMQDAGGAHNTVCTAVTDAQGMAFCQATSSDDPLLIIDGILFGYNAVFNGNGAYFPATAHGRITPFI